MRERNRDFARTGMKFEAWSGRDLEKGIEGYPQARALLIFE